MQHKSPEIPWSNRTANLAHLLTRHAARLTDKPALIWGDLTLTWSELDARVSALAHVMQTKYGVRLGDRVLVQTPNNNQIVEIMFACWRVGALWVPTNFRQHPHEMLHAVQKAKPALLFCSQSCRPHAETAVEEDQNLPVVWIGSGSGDNYEDLIAVDILQVTWICADIGGFRCCFQG